MELKELALWLKERELLSIVIAHYPFFEEIIINNLNGNRLKNQFVVISDLGKEGFRIPALISACYLFAAKSLGFNTIFIHWKNKEFRDEKLILQQILDLNDECIIALSSSKSFNPFKIIGSNLRKYSKIKGHKFVTMTNLIYLKNEMFPSFVYSMRADPVKMHNKGLKIKEQIDKASIVRIKTKKGTDLIVKKNNIKAIINSGLYLNKGEGGNLPAGEVYFHPLGFDNVNGIVILDGSIKTYKGTIQIRNPITLTIKDGLIIDIKGSSEARILAETFERGKLKAINPEHVNRISEIGIGINPNARLIGPTIIDEKVMKTVHIANGSNHWFNGPIITNIHLDHVFRDPIIYVDDKLLDI
jgi:hypothetical protein